MLEILLIEIGTALLILAGALLVSKAIQEQGSKKIEVSVKNIHSKIEEQVSKSGKKIKSRADVKEITKLALKTKPKKINIKTNINTFNGKSK